MTPSTTSSKTSKSNLQGVDLPGHLRFVKHLGCGAYGTVYLCEDTNTNMQVAVKHLKGNIKHEKSVLREIRVLSRLRHDNLVHLLDFPAVPSPSFTDIFLVLPSMRSDLHRVIQSQQKLTDKHVQVITVQILRALEHLHAAGVAHRDLKPANVLLESDCKVKVCDFGLARGDMPGLDGEEVKACGVLTEYVVTRWYRAPEVMLLPKQYTSSVDLWSVGCILAEILGRKVLFPGKNHIDMIAKVAMTLGNPSDEDLEWLPKERDAYTFLRVVCPQSSGIPLSELFPKASSPCLDLMSSLLCWDPVKRPSATEALGCEYLVSYKRKVGPEPPEPFDWSFDGYQSTSTAAKERLYLECARYHPEIVDRDWAVLEDKHPWLASTLIAASRKESTPARNADGSLSSKSSSRAEDVRARSHGRFKETRNFPKANVASDDIVHVARPCRSISAKTLHTNAPGSARVATASGRVRAPAFR